MISLSWRGVGFGVFVLARAFDNCFFVTSIPILTIQSHPSEKPAGWNGDESPKLIALINPNAFQIRRLFEIARPISNPHDFSELVGGGVGDSIASRRTYDGFIVTFIFILTIQTRLRRG